MKAIYTATGTKINLSFHQAECSLKTASLTFSGHFKFYFDVTQCHDI